jgi:hypothetical protein
MSLSAANLKKIAEKKQKTKKSKNNNNNINIHRNSTIQQR